MKTLYVMQGVPGSGKTTMANAILNSARSWGEVVDVLSTDDWRYPIPGAAYEYSPETNKLFHTACQKKAIARMQDEDCTTLIIDNTNITRWQAEPYLVLARIFDYQVQVVRVSCDVEVAIARQLDRSEDRRVPEHVIRMMHEQMEPLL